MSFVLWGQECKGTILITLKFQGTQQSRLLKHTVKYWFSKQLQVLQFDFRDTLLIND